MKHLKMFAQLTKVDVAKQEVIGRAVQEVVDRVDEMFDYASSKPHFEAWSKGFAEDTDGKSLGNLRAMHGKVAAGKVVAIDFNDADKAIDIRAKVVDVNEWNKVLEGVYTGFSIGGSYVGDGTTEKIDGKDVRRYTAKPAEISIVDSPCIPTCKFFEVVKADGAVDKVEFKPASLDVKGSPDDVAAFAKALNDAGMTMAEATALVVTNGTAPAPTKAEPTEIEALITAGLAIIDLGKTLADPATTMSTFAAIVEKHCTPEECNAFDGKDRATVAKAVLAKAKMSTANMDRLQAAHDHLASMGANCGDDGDKAHATGDLAKATPDAIAKAFETAVAPLRAEIETHKAKIKNLEAQPVAHVLLRTTPVSKAQDNGTAPARDGDATDDVVLEPADYIRNGDGSIDYATSKLNKRAKQALAKAGT